MPEMRNKNDRAGATMTDDKLPPNLVDCIIRHRTLREFPAYYDGDKMAWFHSNTSDIVIDQEQIFDWIEIDEKVFQK
jgi:hypothetical protein